MVNVDFQSASSCLFSTRREVDLGQACGKWCQVTNWVKQCGDSLQGITFSELKVFSEWICFECEHVFLWKPRDSHCLHYWHGIPCWCLILCPRLVSSPEHKVNWTSIYQRAFRSCSTAHLSACTTQHFDWRPTPSDRRNLPGLGTRQSLLRALILHNNELMFKKALTTFVIGIITALDPYVIGVFINVILHLTRTV